MDKTPHRPFPVVSPVFKILLLTLFSLLTGCKKDVHSEAVEKQRQRVDSLMRASMENQKRLETEEELAERIRRMMNRNMKSTDSVFYNARVLQLPDSLMYAINLFGKVNQNGKILSFTKTMVTYDGNLAEGEMKGRYFRMDNPAPDLFNIYSLDTTAGKVNAYTLNTAEKKLSLRPMAPEINYYFNLLKQNTFKFDIEEEDRFFRTLKAHQVTKDSVIDSIFQKAEVYNDPNQILPADLRSPFRLFWIRSDQGTRNILFSESGDSAVSAITLSGKSHSKGALTWTHSRFVNDSVFKQYKVTDSLVLDDPHLVVYQKDSVTNTFAYDRAFTFNRLSSDTVRTLHDYPQRYPALADSIFEITSAVFEMNGRKAFWRYTIAYDKASNPTSRVGVKVYYKDLMDEDNSRLIFRLPQFGTPSKSTLRNLLYPEAIFPTEDLNFDGATDLSFTKGTDNNGNPTLVVYLYDKTSGRFKRTPELDGVSADGKIITDPTNQRLLYPGYIGSGHLSVSIVHPGEKGKGSKEIYWTTGDEKAPRLHYQKMLNNAVIEKQSPLPDSLPVVESNLKNTLIQWILTRENAQ
ncbi:XAC2610-related protein [Robertkochia flava]|uniref:XAC2610-related protein n=1 Tax=Robertkochia flava TaxID=3447986 RepID=UPI001CCBC0BB|nr:hypothetical protein [Robertkochia marina]